MAKSRTRTPAGPTLSPPQAVALLKADLDKAQKIAAPRIPQEGFTAWAANALHNLQQAFGEESPQAQQFDGILHSTYPIGVIVSGGYRDSTDYDQLRGGALQRAIPLLESSLESLALRFPEQGTAGTAPSSPRATTRDVFIVHGHDEALKSEVARFVEKLGLRAIILHEQPNRGQTVIEKFEKNAGSVMFAIVLLTPDDHGGARADAPATRPRARQNVILELGYFIGALRRDHVCALYRGDDLELPSDISGVVYIKYDGQWKIELAQELKHIWSDVDLNRAFA